MPHATGHLPSQRALAHLEPNEAANGRPFTEPGNTRRDLAIVNYMRQRLVDVLSEPASVTDPLDGLGRAQPGPMVLNYIEEGVRRHRIVIAQLGLLLEARELTFVAFCGEKEPGVDWSLLDQIDIELIQEFPQHPDLLSYSSVETERGDWRNLVLMRSPAGIDHWRGSVLHAHAAHILAPDHYRSVRLHAGLFPDGLKRSENPIVVRTKYYDFREEEPWRAVRQLRSFGGVLSGA